MSPWMQITAWTLIHFVWQGGLLALATAAGIRLCRRRSSEARLRHRVRRLDGHARLARHHRRVPLGPWFRTGGR